MKGQTMSNTNTTLTPEQKLEDKTVCWNCNSQYEKDAGSCPECCASNANIWPDSAALEVENKSVIDHDWKFVDDSFDHEYGCKQVHYFECSRCGATRDVEPGEFDFEEH